MTRNTLLLLALVLLVLIGIVLLDARNSRNTPSNASRPIPRSDASRQHRREGGRESSRSRESGRREEPRMSCASIGVACASQYFASWQWPADQSCQATTRGGYPEPDRRCTPGGVVPGVTADTLRAPSWSTRCLRNCQSSEQQKHAAYAWYGLSVPPQNSGQTQVCELDHLVPLELGGADDMGNIWPQCGPDDATLRARYFKQKDIVENYLAARVRAGQMPLTEAQQGIATDWVQYLASARAACAGSRCGTHPAEP
ncbi:hypothetical protein [Acidipila sp. EB88]|uniref:hypothetical protein n=1 Tax=Acidipila sp. EB88 TaxID=2305226 RepID=UPI000F5EE11D|nr:hypothetical protein [Acidipila sp. EB88]RRA49538.1 hypothetical protein D1Y84_15920 [Acidipila sp. EB88]